MKILITIVFTLFFSLSVFAQKQAEVVVTSTYLRKSPDYNSEKVQTLQKGEKVTFERSRETNGWFYVSVSEGTVKGWIRSDTVRSVKAEPKINQPAIPTQVKNEPKVNQPSNQATAKNEPKASQPTNPATRRTLPIPESAENVKTQKPVVSTSQTTNSSPVPTGTPEPTPSETPEIVEDQEVLRIDTAEVTLNVRVVNNSNRPVNNLNPSDFKIYEDGVLQPITSLTTAEVPVINALVIDNSRSLRSQLKKVIEAGKIIVGTNRPDDESSIVRFVSSDKIEVVQDFTSKTNSLNNALDNLFVEGGQTAIIDAVYKTAQKVNQYQISDKKEDVKLRALILVSDGDDRGSSFNERQLFELLRGSNVQIYPIGFINDLSKEPESNGISRQEKAKTFLTKLAQETGGKVYFPNSIDELPQIATEISGELRTQYLISYSPTNEIRDGSFRQIKVEIAEGANNEKRTAITRSGRNVPPK